MKIEWCCNVRYMNINPEFRTRLPAMGEEIRVVTWSKGSRGFRPVAILRSWRVMNL